MSAKFFLDSNLILYGLSSDESKKAISLDLMDGNPIISTQVLAEVSSVCLKKLKLPHETLLEYLELLNHQCNVQLLLPGDFSEAVSLAKKYRYGFYDSLIIAAALRTECEILYSEDMHHGHNVEKLTIINPFK